jgi:hypothetical protein
MENGKTDAMAPKKNAAPAEAPKSLGATIQNVITKAVTSPTDGKIDFAQGVNHITGDPQQKSAKPAEPMQSLKAGYDMKPKSETYEDKEEVKEADEKEDEKMMKAQADIKKMNASVHKKDDMKEAEDKKSEMIKAEIEKMKKEMADKKDELKAQVDKEKEMNEGEMPKAALDALKKSQEKKETAHDGEKKELKAQKDKEDVKEESEDEKKKELKAQKDDEKEVKEEKEDEKKEIKASAKDKVKDMDMKEDVAALTDGEELSEEFKAKAATIFESAVKAKLVEEIEKLEGEYETKVAEKVEETKEEIVEKVDAYLNYVVESWMKDNELAIEKGLKSEITEDFIGGMKKLFETHYIDLPDSKFDVVEDQAAQIVKLKEDMNKTLEANVELNQKIGEFARDEIINDVSSDLAETEKEKLKGLAESIEYVDAADYRGKVETLKNSYFPAQKASDTESNEVAATENMTSDVDLSESMAAYTAAISKNQAKKLY